MLEAMLKTLLLITWPLIVLKSSIELNGPYQHLEVWNLTAVVINGFCNSGAHLILHVVSSLIPVGIYFLRITSRLNIIPYISLRTGFSKIFLRYQPPFSLNVVCSHVIFFATAKAKMLPSCGGVCDLHKWQLVVQIPSHGQICMAWFWDWRLPCLSLVMSYNGEISIELTVLMCNGCLFGWCSLQKYPPPEDWLYKEARGLFLEPEVVDCSTVDLKWNEPDEDGLIKFMCDEKQFR